MRILTRHRKPVQEFGVTLHMSCLHCRAEPVPSFCKCWKVQGRDAGCAFPLPEPMLSARRLSQPLWRTAQKNQRRPTSSSRAPTSCSSSSSSAFPSRMRTKRTGQTSGTTAMPACLELPLSFSLHTTVRAIPWHNGSCCETVEEFEAFVLNHCGLSWLNYWCDAWNGIHHSLSLAKACLANVCLLMQGTMLRATWLRRRALPSKQGAVRCILTTAACSCYSIPAYLSSTRWERSLSRVCVVNGLLRFTDMRRHATLSATCPSPSSGRSP